ncbi:uncharacterized protein VNE69_04196 [Vairimorpha necatrix]|uniref:Uncharacterized protein n=1 Tax=Vairimorpha necatrix TaxID=6039 RepID=A0AAX4JBN6_9MICR
MNMVKIFASLIFIMSSLEVLDNIHNNQKVYDELATLMIKKIEEKDYVQFNCSEEFIKVYLCYNSEYKKFYMHIEMISSFEFNVDSKQIVFQHDNKSVNEITEVIEYYVKQYFENEINESIIFVYDLVSFENCFIMKKIVENIRRINENRRVNKKGWEIYYDYICETDCYFLSMLHSIKDGLYMNENNINIFDVRFCYITKHFDTYIRFCIVKKEICYLFEFKLEAQNINRLITLYDANIKLRDEYDRDILNKMLVLCKVADIDVIENYNITDKFIFTPNMIELPKSNIKIFLESDKVCFKYTFGEYKYHLKNNLVLEDGKLYIERKEFSEFKFFFENLSTTNNVSNDIKTVEMIFRILRNHDKIEFLITKILKNKGFFLNIIYTHLLFSGGTLTQNAFNILMDIEDEAINEALIKKVVDITHKNIHITNSLHFYLIKKCLRMEAERFINETNVDDDLVYRTFIDIYHLIVIKKATNESELAIKKNNISCMKIIQEAIITYKNYINNYKSALLKHLGEITLMYTELYDFYGNVHWQHEHKKNEIINPHLDLDKNAVEKNTNIIMLKLSENTKIENKYQERRKQKEKNFKKLIKIYNNHLVHEKIDQVIEKAQYLNSENFLEKETRTILENNLINDGMQIIESAFNNYIPVKGKTYIEKIMFEVKNFFSTNIDEESAFEFKIKKEESFKKNIYLIIKNKTKERGKAELPKAIKNLFNSIFEKDAIKKEKSKKLLENIKTVLEKQEFKTYLNKEFSKDIHNELVKVLEMHDKNK